MFKKREVLSLQEDDERVSIRFGVQTLKYRNMRKRRREGSPEARKARKRQLKLTRKRKRETSTQKEEVAGAAFCLSRDSLHWRTVQTCEHKVTVGDLDASRGTFLSAKEH